ncbi:tRNA (adenine(22)-N(1))-methyltransferase TrmK [Deinococcus petrolearius]|uniref:tRNA (Adenine(22)-N(1))-methyltransferase TrmK n=1 Tax=Deinococcus petrolearius TaxID=1751295 RepID=A0ABW1DKH5_9DEIO
MTPATLDARLGAVLALVRAEVHADIGTDHARLPVALIRSGRARRCVAVDLNPGPLAQARRNVAGAGLAGRIEVRPGDGFAPLRPGEADSASLCGMGAATIRGVLERAGVALPPRLVLQPNDSPEPLRVWAQARGYHLTAETLAAGYWLYPVLALERADGPDPAYAGLPPAAALRYGPLLLRAAGAALREQVEADLRRLTPHAAPGRPAERELATAQEARAWLDGGA